MSYLYYVETLRAGQPRAYADTVHEYLITITYTPEWGNDRSPRPWVAHKVMPHSNHDLSLDPRRKVEQRNWAKQLAKALCQDFREHGDNDGLSGMDAHFYPTLSQLQINEVSGTVRVVITTPFTD